MPYTICQITSILPNQVAYIIAQQTVSEQGSASQMILNSWNLNSQFLVALLALHISFTLVSHFDIPLRSCSEDILNDLNKNLELFGISNYFQIGINISKNAVTRYKYTNETFPVISYFISSKQICFLSIFVCTLLWLLSHMPLNLIHSHLGCLHSKK